METQDPILKLITDYIKDKTVLDIGCVEHNLENRNKDRLWAHKYITKNSKKTVGIDIQNEAIKKLKEEGYNVYHQNAENFELHMEFDVIFAGEIIEHLSNPGLFLERVKKHLSKDGLLIITTPNAFSVYRLLGIIKRFTNDPLVNGEHVCWYSPKVIKQLLVRHNYFIKKLTFTNYPFIDPKITSVLSNYICNIIGTKFRETMIVVAYNKM